MKNKLAFILAIIFIACNSDKEIRRLLSSSEPYDNILGAYKAMQTDDLIYVPLLLKKAYSQEATTALKFKGVSVYEQDMYALQHILKVKAPKPVTNIVDSANVKFFINYWKDRQR